MAQLRVLTNSERSSFACERLWFFQYVEGLSTSITPTPLRYGSLIHACIDAWNRGGAQVEVPVIERDVIEPWLEQRREWADEQNSDEAEETYEEDEKLADTASKIMAGYVKRWAKDHEEWETIAVEPQLARWLVHPETGKPIRDVGVRKDGSRFRRRWAYGGRKDRIARHIPTDTIWQFETKTMTGAFDAYCRRLHFDPQTRGYAWAQMNPIKEYTDPRIAKPIKVEGVIYDLVRKHVPTIPKPLSKCGNCGHPKSKHPTKEDLRLDPYATCSGSKGCDCVLWVPAALSTAEIDTTRDTYLKAILDNDLDPDDYTDHLEKLPGLESFFHREQYSFTEDEIEDFGADAAWSALDMIRAEKRPHHPRQTRVCQMFGCPGRFESICRQDGEMARKAFTVTTIRHRELEGELADAKAGKDRGVGVQNPTQKQDASEDVDDVFAGI